MMMKILGLVFLLHISASLFSQKPEEYIKEGNDYYAKGQMSNAIAAYNKVIGEKYKYVALMNKGNALYRQKKYDEAINTYQQVSNAKAVDANTRSGAYYNTGVVYSNQKKIQESIEQYKHALRLNWQDVKARENLQKALMELKQQSGGGGGGGQDKTEQQKQSKLNKSQARQQLQRLEQKERQTQDKISGQKNQYGGSAGKDW